MRGLGGRVREEECDGTHVLHHDGGVDGISKHA